MNLVIIENRQAVTSSKQVADYFGKRNVEVMDSIRSIEPDISSVEFSTLFKPAEYKASNGKKNPMYLMNRDGFSPRNGFYRAKGTRMEAQIHSGVQRNGSKITRRRITSCRIA